MWVNFAVNFASTALIVSCASDYFFVNFINVNKANVILFKIKFQ